MQPKLFLGTVAPHIPLELQRRFDELLDHLPAGVVVHARDGSIVSANRLACELLGRSEQALVGDQADLSGWEFLRADGSPLPHAEFPVYSILQTGDKVADMVIGMRGHGHGHHDGHGHAEDDTRWMICNAYPEFDEDGSVHQVIVCFTDCTGLKLAERHAQKSEERLRLAVLGSTDAPWDWDLVKGETYYSERWWDMLGYVSGEMVGEPETWAHLMHPEDQARIRAFLIDLLKGSRDCYSVELRLRHRDGHYVPVLSRGYVMRDAHGMAVRISGTNTDLTERKRAEQRIHELAYFDPLTGLPNRRFLMEQLGAILARCKRSTQYGALLFIDLDNFKLLNDTMGHDVGDMLLRQVAQRLRTSLRGCDQLARLGGDEFVVMLDDLGFCADEAAAETRRVAAKILSVLGQPFRLESTVSTSTPSIGVTMFDGGPNSIDNLLKQADLAMYRAKAEGRNTVRFFEPGMQSAADRQAALETALRAGLAEQQFVLFCQPQFDRHGELVGAEALLRWDRGALGIIGPGDFINLAEASGLIVPLGLHVLEQGCRLLALWARDPVLGQLKLAVNVSVHQLREASFPHTVATVLDATGAPPERLTLEITESVFAEHVPDVIYRMHQLRDMGVEFSLDDFGTGYSSLGYLRRFPLAALKIDRSFVHDAHTDPGTAAIVESIVGLARKLGLCIVAEGIEEPVQREFLLGCGCDALQGYLLGRPMPVADFARLYGAPAPTSAGTGAHTPG
ncbi:sensor domain-containing protein [Massilia niastensis]|uniref:sensor domain-containing protein n=1 Tax=Massilia niastensis TaxID=544911 RepID=UPI0012EBD085|nr:GGDEF and EAL domain-containing protein [Massilia niastensis]